MIRVLHVEAGRHLYGGAQQVAYLLRALPRDSVQSELACARGAAIAAPARAAGATVHELPMRGDLDLALIPGMRRLIRELRPGLVHLHSRRGVDTLAALAARCERVPVILSRRVDNPEPWLAVKLKYRLYDRVITISEGIREALLASGVRGVPMTVVRSAVDADDFEHPAPRTEFLRHFDLADDALCVGVVAQLIPRKGHRVLFAALPPLLQAYPQLRVLCFGQGAARDALLEILRGENLEARVKLVGFHADLPRWMPHFDLLVHPALMEGLGVTLLQAAAAGVPVIASRAGGMPEAVHEGINGLLVPPGDVAALREAMARLLADAGLRARFAAAGRRLARSEYGIDTMAQRTLAVYREVLARRSQ